MIQDMLVKYCGMDLVHLANNDEVRLARQLLSLTDWMIIREIETGFPCPQEVKDARALARTQIP